MELTPRTHQVPTYRTEMYLQQREEQEQQQRRMSKSPTPTITTWKNLKNQKKIFQDDQEEIDRVVSIIDSIHSTFNRSLLTLNHEIYSSLYGDDHLSTHLMKTFCRRQDYFSNCNLSMKDADDDDDDDDDSNAQNLSNLFDNFLQKDTDTISNDDEEENEREKKNSYDSAYGSIRPNRQLSRESLLNVK